MSGHFVWVDLETTGLVAAENRILEVGIVVTDTDLNAIASDRWVVAYSETRLAHWRNRADEVVQEMHDASGLWTECAKNGLDLDVVERKAIEFINVVIGFDEKPPMCGSSLRLDRNFIDFWMPKLADRFHYRTIDVSTVREIARAWRPELTTREPEGLRQHRTIADCMDSIKLLRFYQDHFFDTHPTPYDPPGTGTITLDQLKVNPS